jgi:hypothetical protein
MSILGIHQFTRDIERDASTRTAYLADPAATLSRYRLDDGEKQSIRALDAADLLQRGVNAIVIRNMLVTLGITHQDMYTHQATAGDQA